MSDGLQVAPPDEARRIRVGLAWALLGVVLFSFSLPLTKVAIGGFSPYQTAMGRAVIAGAVAAVLLAVRRVPFPAREHLRPIVFTTVGAVFGWPILLALALQRTTSAHAAVIAAFMPLTTALIAVLRTGERVSRQFWIAASVGTAALVAFALSRGGGEGDDLLADVLVIGAVLFSSTCYVLGAEVTKAMPGWQVISWVVVIALPITVPASILLWWFTHDSYDPTATEWARARPARAVVDVPRVLRLVPRALDGRCRLRRAGAADPGAAHAALVGVVPRRARDGGHGGHGGGGHRLRRVGPAQPCRRRRRPGGVSVFSSL